jgi:hypothetical protein
LEVGFDGEGATLYNDWDSASFKAVTTDGYGNVYAVGSYYGGGTAYFGSQSWMGTNSGDTAIVVMYGKDGSVNGWAEPRPA